MWAKPKACPRRASAGRHLPRRPPVARVVDNFHGAGGSGILLLLVSIWFAWCFSGVSRKGRVGEHLDARWEVLTKVEAPNALAVVPIEPVPVRRWRADDELAISRSSRSSELLAWSRFMSVVGVTHSLRFRTFSRRGPTIVAPGCSPRHCPSRPPSRNTGGATQCGPYAQSAADCALSTTRCRSTRVRSRGRSNSVLQMRRNAMGEEKGFALSPVRAREMRRFLERNGYEGGPSQHKHLRLRHDRHGNVLLPLRPGDNLSYVAVKQIAAALGMEPEDLIRQSR